MVTNVLRGLVVLLFMLPAPVLMSIAVLIAVLVLVGYAATVAGRAAERREKVERRRKEERERLIRNQAAAAKRQREEAARQKKRQLEQRAGALAAAKRKLEEQARLDDKRRVEVLGKHGAELVKRAKSSVKRVVSSEAARDGWLGDVEFAPDVEAIEANLLKARAFRARTDDLSALPQPNDDDRKIIAEAKATITQLERNAKERVELLDRCAKEAHLIDESLRREREEAKLTVRREELHGELAAMLYGVEVAATNQSDSTADAVMARVQAYRDIKGQIERARDGADAPAGTEHETGDDSGVTWIPSPIRDAWKWVVD